MAIGGYGFDFAVYQGVTFSGVVGYRAYNRFEAGQTRYFSHRLRKPA